MIIALVGNSGTGKTHLSNFLKQRLGIPVIVSYTTRPNVQGKRTDGIIISLPPTRFRRGSRC